jgi:aspartyl-tRNA(Asn)/glutamyl-tRNA(Gln) amidotransferase subunit B
MRSIFHRKNYFYPDLPKGYQVSQYGETNPLGYDGYLDIPRKDGTIKRVKIRRVHLEEDTGKLMHLPSGGSGVDYNRAGVPLMEIVTEFPPDICDPDEAKDYLQQLRQTRDGKMEEGSLRCEPNISVRLVDSEKFGTKTELKNLNSFRSVQLGVQFEVRRQIATIEQGGSVAQETRGWNEEKQASYLMRIKEAENDYRYFPDPDLVPMVFNEEYIEGLRADLPELPLAKFRRYTEDFGLSVQHAGVICDDLDKANFFEAAIAKGGNAQEVNNWLTGDFAKLLNHEGIRPQESKITPEHLVDLTKLVIAGTISGKIAKDVFSKAFQSGKLPSEIVQASGATQISDDGAIRQVVLDVLKGNPEVVAKYKTGQANVKGFLVGQVMKGSGGRANPEMVQRIVTEELEKQ